MFFLIIVIEYRLVLQKGFKVFFLFNRTLLTSLHLLIDNSEWTDILIFVVSRITQICCSVQDDKLEKFLYNCRMTLEQKIPARKTEIMFENELKLSIQEVSKAKGENLIQFLPLVLDRLLYLMVRPPVLGGQQGKCSTDIVDLAVAG